MPHAYKVVLPVLRENSVPAQLRRYSFNANRKAPGCANQRRPPKTGLHRPGAPSSFFARASPQARTTLDAAESLARFWCKQLAQFSLALGCVGDQSPSPVSPFALVPSQRAPRCARLDLVSDIRLTQHRLRPDYASTSISRKRTGEVFGTVQLPYI